MSMDLIEEDLDPQEIWDAKERARRADVEALRSGRKTPAQLQRENFFFAFAEGRMRVNLDSARSLS
jgi:hypothetical protein